MFLFMYVFIYFHSCTVHFDLSDLLLLQPTHNNFPLKH